MMKSFSMNKVLGTIKKRPTFGNSSNGSVSDPNGESPEASATRFVKQFCESGGSQTGDDITFLPPIVDAAESSPAAAAECARIIRKFLQRDYWSRPSFQYNAIMLIRILSDNPGATFTRNFDKKFVDVTKELLRSGRDPSVRQMLMETLDNFENTKGYDEGLGLLIEMWKKEKEKAYKAYGGAAAAPAPRALNAPAFDPHSQEYFNRTHNNRKLPNPVELANRLEEARTSAKLLEQVVGCTPPAEILNNDLIKEFADRCLSASRSIQGYMTTEPAPDNDTMESLIDTNEQLQQALNHHQRAVLQAKKRLGLGERSSTSTPSVGQNEQGQQVASQWQPPSDQNEAVRGAIPPLPVRKPSGKGKGTASYAEPGPSRSNSGTPRHDDEADPFRDPVPESSSRQPGRASNELPRLPFEPFHPGFSPTTPSSSGAKLDPVTPVSDEGHERDDAYHATPPRKTEHLYRY
ncbi:hypothetical protein QBC47DRAFT_138387 [Echria macrotheca]|uniref:GAT domain-containing protein n=1 Tax=Echria macrotheca TaxID=438768 RepID=A0AAJ0BHH2_9PEZI|nr:hypothetical protein QBC47DRAFT_138387 [Echria macrotheca]